MLLLDEVTDVTENESPDESDPYLPNPADAIDVPKNLKGGAEFHCELDEYAAFVQVFFYMYILHKNIHFKL